MSDVRIVVLQRGWVIVGEYERDGLYGRVRNGACIRRWGTTKGLGQLAFEGPTSNTVLEPEPDGEFLELTVIRTIKCNESAWAGKLGPAKESKRAKR